MKHPRVHVQDPNDDVSGQLVDQDRLNLDSLLPVSAENENKTSDGKNPLWDGKNELSRMSTSNYFNKKSRKSSRVSLMGYNSAFQECHNFL